MTNSVVIYLRDHEAAARGGVDLFRRVTTAQRTRDHGPELAVLRDQVVEDLASLHLIMRDLGADPSLLLGLTMRLGERLGRLKPNGRLVSRTPLSDLIEIEGLADAVQAKESGWRALAAAGAAPADELERLLGRAQEQATRLKDIHAAVARTVLVDRAAV